MGEYSKFISEKRRSIPTPHSIVDENGICVFGTFDKEFVGLDLVKAKKPTSSPQSKNKKRLTLWEAIEIHFDEGILFAVVSDMDLFGTNLNIWFDKRSREVTTWMTNLNSKDTVIAPNLLGTVAKAEHKRGYIRCENNLQEDKLRVEGEHNNGDVLLKYDLNLTRESKPSVVSIPFGENRPLYSQKDFFSVSGSVNIGGEEIVANERTAAIMDDHRGYYPKRMHYDWLSTMGRNPGNPEQYFGFNLTCNQSLNQDDYNENLIWKGKETSLLPPIAFSKNVPIKNYKKSDVVWEVKDQHDMVNVTFKVEDCFKMVVHALVINIDYYIAFGTLNGYIRDEDGNKIILDGLTGMGEDKSMFF